MAKQNEYLARQRAREAVIQTAAKQTYQQYMTDLFILTLNDPEIMGRDTLGYARLRKVLDGVERKYDQYFEALNHSGESDYLRGKMDEALQKIIGDRDTFYPFEQRYEFLKEIVDRK